MTWFLLLFKPTPIPRGRLNVSFGIFMGALCPAWHIAGCRFHPRPLKHPIAVVSFWVVRTVEGGLSSAVCV